MLYKHFQNKYYKMWSEKKMTRVGVYPAPAVVKLE